MSDTVLSSPVREDNDALPGVPVVLRANDIDYADGAEARVLEHILSVSDRSSLSDELERRAQDWIEAYHLNKSRANIVRALSLPADARVLEVGAGCGPVTRYLGEQCALVDAVEPVPLRARAAAERVRDLDSVRVFVGELEDVPAEPTYDVVLFCGVLEWLGNGTPDHDFYIGVLTEARRRLAPGGAVVIAIENQLGVKYFAGAPEDHTGRIFDGVEGYLRGSNARTWSRRELGQICADSGLQPTFLHAFPDYKMTRVVMHDDFVRNPRTADAVVDIPRFPSDSYPAMNAWQLGDERGMWQSLVSAGLGDEHANSFLVVATASDDSTTPTPLWPEGQLTRFFNTRGRTTRFTTDVTMRTASDGDIVIHRDLLSWTETPNSGHLTLTPGDEPFIDGVTLTDALITDPASRTELLRRWRDLVVEIHANGPSGDWLIDAVPRNVRVDAEGRFHLIDQEWVWRGACSVEAILRRGLFLFVLDLAQVLPATQHDLTVRAVALGLGVDLALDSDWIDEAIAFEAELQCLVGGVPEGDGGRRRAEIEEALRQQFASPLSVIHAARSRVPGPPDVETGIRIDRLAVAERGRLELEQERALLVADRDRIQADLEETQHALTHAQSGRAWSEGALSRSEEARAQAEQRAAQFEDEARRLQASYQDLEDRYHQLLEQFQTAVGSRGWRAMEAMRKVKGRIPRP